MEQSQLDKLFGLVSRTGDKLVIVDKINDLMIVLMNLTDYESLLNNVSPIKGLSEEAMMSKINRDIALWRSHNQSQDLAWYDPVESRSIGQDKTGGKSVTGSNVVDRFDSDSWLGEEENNRNEEQPLYFEHESINGLTVPIAEKPSDFGEIEMEESLADVLTEDEELEFKPEPILEPI